MERMRQTMPKEEQEKLKKMGEYMYGDMDFENGNIDNSLYETYVHIRAALRSGLNIEDLDEDEKGVMQSQEGEDWESNWK